MPRSALPPPDADRLMNYAEAAALLGVNVQTLRQQSRCRPADLRKAGPFADLAWFKLGTSVRIWRSALLRWIADHQPEAEREPEPEPVQVGLPPRRRGRPSKARLALEQAERASQKAEAAERERERRAARRAQRTRRRQGQSEARP